MASRMAFVALLATRPQGLPARSTRAPPFTPEPHMLLPSIKLQFFVSLSALALALAGCSTTDAGTGTGGKRLAFTVKATGGPEAKQGFTTEQGWSVTLSKAQIASGALYWFDGEILFSRAPSPSLLDRALGVRVAYAHPGHYVPGNAKGEMLQPTSFDLVKGDAELGAANGVSGIFRSATFSFGSPASGPVASELGAHVAVLEGLAKKGAEERAFRAEVDAADVLDSTGKPQVTGCPFTEIDIQSEGTITLLVKIGAWFDQVEFDQVAKGEAGKPSKLEGVPQAELVRSMRGADRYVFSFAAR